MFHKKTVNIPIYRGTLDICISDDREKVCSLYTDFSDYTGDIFAHTLHNTYGRKVVVILNPAHKYSNITPGIIAHEAVHVASFVFNSRGVLADHENDEPLAYFVEWVVDEINKYLNSLKIEIK